VPPPRFRHLWCPVVCFLEVEKLYEEIFLSYSQDVTEKYLLENENIVCSVTGRTKAHWVTSSFGSNFLQHLLWMTIARNFPVRLRREMSRWYNTSLLSFLLCMVVWWQLQQFADLFVLFQNARCLDIPELAKQILLQSSLRAFQAGSDTTCNVIILFFHIFCIFSTFDKRVYW